MVPLALALFSGLLLGGASGGCTRGRLFLVDDASAQVAVYELDGSPSFSSPLALVPHLGPGDARRLIKASSTEAFVGIVNLATRDVPDLGRVSFIDAGISPGIHHMEVVKTAPSGLEFHIQCTYPIHYVAMNRKIAQFCDGSFDDGINSTVWLVDETKLRSGDALIYSMTLPGSHHGVAVPLDGTQLLYSVPTEERVNGDATAALPSGFEVFDHSTGQVVHGLNEDGDPHQSCVGFHGEAHHEDMVAFACNQDHGGILLVQTGNVVPPFTSRTIDYPAGKEMHRTGGLHAHEQAPLLVGDFNDRATPGSYHMLAFNPHDPGLETMSMEHVQFMGDRPCGYGYEKAAGELLLTWMPTGNLKVWLPYPRWMLVSDITLVPGQTTCDDTAFMAGHGSAYVMVNKALHEVDLAAFPLVVTSHGDLAVKPHTGIVAGVPPGFHCAGPQVPSHPGDREGATGFLLLRLPSDEATSPGSSAQADLLMLFRAQTSAALGVGLDRVFVQHFRREPMRSADARDFLLELFLADPGAKDTNQTKGSELYSALSEQLAAGGSTPSTWGFAQGGLTATPYTSSEDSESDDGMPTGAIVGLVVAIILAVVCAAAAVAFFLRGRALRSELARLKGGANSA